MIAVLQLRATSANDADKLHIPPIQQKIKITAASSKELIVEDPIRFTIDTHDVYPQNSDILDSAVGFGEDDYQRVSDYIGAVAPRFSGTGNTGMFGPIDSQEPHANDPEYRAAAPRGGSHFSPVV